MTKFLVFLLVFMAVVITVLVLLYNFNKPFREFMVKVYHAYAEWLMGTEEDEGKYDDKAERYG